MVSWSQFSIFSSSFGSSYATALAASVAKGTTHFGVRMQLTAINFDPVKVSFNSGTHTLSTLGNIDVSDVSLQTPNGTIGFDFPSTYNHGPMAAALKDGAMMPVDGSGSVKIKVSWCCKNSIFGDYLFDVKHAAAADRYLLYDPDVRAVYVAPHTVIPPAQPPQPSTPLPDSSFFGELSSSSRFGLVTAIAVGVVSLACLLWAGWRRLRRRRKAAIAKTKRRRSSTSVYPWRTSDAAIRASS